MFIMISVSVQANCTNVYASAGYSLSHSKKSLEANNFEHQQYYAERALKAFKKAQEQIQNCGCDASVNIILDGIENLETSLSQTDWDMGRYYTKKALENAQQLLESIDVCTTGNNVNNTDGSDFEEEEDPELINNPEVAVIKSMQAQLDFQRLAEIDIINLESAIRDLATLFECEQALHILNDRKARSEAEMEAESIEATKAFYRSQVIAIHNKTLFALINCSKNKTQ